MRVIDTVIAAVGRRSGRWATRLARAARFHLLVGALVVYPVSLRAQDPSRDTPPAEAEGAQRPEGVDRWDVVPSEAVDLWFHALAVAGVGDDGPLPLYSRDYADLVRARKESLNIFPTMLDRAATRIRRTIGRDEGFGFLHVLPLYFLGASVDELLAGLDAVANQRSGDRILTAPGVQFGASVLAEALPVARGREFLGDLVRVLRNEHDVFFHEFWAQEIAPADARLDTLRGRWREGLALDLAVFFDRVGVRTGTIVPSPALGVDGRLVQLDPFGTEGRIIAAGMSLQGQPSGRALYGALKELCHAVVDRSGVLEDHLREPSIRTRAAVRCGAIVLQFHAPARLVGYRRLFVAAADPEADRPSSSSAFEATFPLERVLLDRLKAVIRGR